MLVFVYKLSRFPSICQEIKEASSSTHDDEYDDDDDDSRSKEQNQLKCKCHEKEAY